MASSTLLLYNVPSVVDDRCLFDLFQHKVKQTLYSGFSSGRVVFVELHDAALCAEVIRQSHAGAILAASIDEKLSKKVIKAKARKEAAEEKKKSRKALKEAEKAEEKKKVQGDVDDPDAGITLFELLQQEILRRAPARGKPSAASSTAEAASPEVSMYGTAVPEFGPFSNVIINGWRVGICASPVTIDQFTGFGGVIPTRQRREEEDGSPRKKERRVEGDRPASAAVSEGAEDTTADASATSSKPVVMQSTRMRNVNQQAPAFSSASAKTKITFNDNDDEVESSPAPAKKKQPVVFSDSDDEVPAKPAPLAKSQPAAKAKAIAKDAEEQEKTLNNRDRKAAAKSTAVTTSKKFVYSDSDSD